MMRYAVIAAVVLGASACSTVSSGTAETKSGYVGPATMDSDQVTQLLASHGYTQVSGLHKNGDHWVGSAVDQNGAPVSFDIAKDGSIRTK